MKEFEDLIDQRPEPENPFKWLITIAVILVIIASIIFIATQIRDEIALQNLEKTLEIETKKTEIKAKKIEQETMKEIDKGIKATNKITEPLYNEIETMQIQQENKKETKQEPAKKQNNKEKIEIENKNIKVIIVGTKEENSSAVGKVNKPIIGICDNNLSKGIIKSILEEIDGE